MFIFVLVHATNDEITAELPTGTDLRHVKKYVEQTFGFGDFYVTNQGRITNDTDLLVHLQTYHVIHRLRGGKGGFGSMLRTIGAQIEKTTNKEAMRDLSGRRMRDINNEKKLKDWVDKSAEREREREEQRKERMERRRAELEGKRHQFVDQTYSDQKEKVINNLDDAVTQGLKRGAAQESAPSKRPRGKQPASTDWYGIDINDLGSSSDSHDDESYTPESCGKSGESSAAPCEARITDDGAASSYVTLNTTTERKTSTLHTVHIDEVPTSDTDRLCTDEVSTNDTDRVHTEDMNSSKDPLSQDAAGQSVPSNVTDIDLNLHSSAEELEAYGLDCLKIALMKKHLKCGGSLEERAARLFSVKGLQPHEIDCSLLAKPPKGKVRAK